MKILIANWVYDWGSTGYIVRDLKKELERMGHEVCVATGVNYGNDNVMVFSTSSERKLFWRLHRFGLSPFRGSTRASKRLIKYIEQEKPDIVNLHLLHCNYLNLYAFLKWLGQHNIKTVVTNHAELYYTGSCGYSYECCKWQSCECRGCPNRKYATGAYFFGNPHKLWKKMHRAFKWFRSENLSFTAVSPWVKERFILSPIVQGFSCSVTLNGLNVEIFHKREDISTIKKQIGSQPYVLWVTANFNPSDKEDVKGGFYFVELARMIPEQRFLVVATRSSNTGNLPKNVILWGKAKDQNELAQLYSGATLTVLVSRRETFSMVTAESLCCGTPVVGFKAGGPETIAIPQYSQFVEQADLPALVGALCKMLEKKYDRRKISEEARMRFSPKAMTIQYLDAYEKLLKVR